MNPAQEEMMIATVKGLIYGCGITLVFLVVAMFLVYWYIGQYTKKPCPTCGKIGDPSCHTIGCPDD